jgi:hypothetical protein
MITQERTLCGHFGISFRWEPFLPLILASGCTKTFVINDPAPSSVNYFLKHGTPVKLSLVDARFKADKALSSETLPVRLINMENALDFMGENIASESGPYRASVLRQEVTHKASGKLIADAETRKPLPLKELYKDVIDD